MVFSVNQVTQLYVAKTVKDKGVLVNDAAGSIAVKSDKDGYLYFEYMSPAGKIRSDLVNPKHIKTYKVTDGEDMSHKLKAVTVKLDPTVAEGTLIPGQDYILKIAIRQYIGNSDEDIQYKFGAVHAYSGMTATDFYNKMVESLNKNFSREVVKLLDFGVTGNKATATIGGATVTALKAGTDGNKISLQTATDSSESLEVTKSNGNITIKATLVTSTGDTIKDLKKLISSDPIASTLVEISGIESSKVTAAGPTALANGTSTGIYIEEVEQPWKLGVFEKVPVYFEVFPDTVLADGDERIWGTVETTTSEKVVYNGSKIADLEYFCMGARGDIYRNMGWPNSIETQYLVDPSKQYNAINIHYYYVGSNEGAQKSEKDIVLVFPKTPGSKENKDTNKIVNQINTIVSGYVDEADTLPTS